MAATDSRWPGSGWVRACHPGPTVAVTTVVTGLAWALGWSGAGLVLVGGAVLLGQCSVGWSNDAHDAEDDARAQRLEKPTVDGSARPRSLWIAACSTAVASAVLSVLAAGWRGGMWHIVAVAFAWWYNLRLSRSAWSWLPYAVAFACIAPFLSFGRSGTWPPWWLPVALALIGTAAHLANAQRDLELDTSIGMSGTVARLGPQRTTRLLWMLLTVATVVVAIALSRQSLLLAGGSLVVLVLALVCPRLTTRADAAFLGIIALAVIDVGLVAVALRGTH